MQRPTSNRDLGRWVLLGGIVLLLTWITFFDSHSLLRRLRWHHEYEQRMAENERLRQEIETLQRQLQQPLSDKVVEQIAREQYGMKYPDETVYPLEKR